MVRKRCKICLDLNFRQSYCISAAAHLLPSSATFLAFSQVGQRRPKKVSKMRTHQHKGIHPCKIPFVEISKVFCFLPEKISKFDVLGKLPNQRSVLSSCQDQYPSCDLGVDYSLPTINSKQINFPNA